MSFWKDKAAVQSAKLGVFFCILFTSYLSFQNIVTHVYEEQGLSGVGPLNLIATYLSFLISNTLAVKCKLTFKAQLLIGSLAYSVNMSTGIFVPYIQSHFIVYFIVAMGGMVGGISAGFLWVSQGGYLRQACKHQNNKGKYNAIFSLLLSFSSLTAGITTTFFLGYFNNQVYFIALTTLSLCSSLYCIIFLKDLSQQQQTDIIQGQMNQTVTLEEKNKDSVLQNVISSLKFYKKMVFVLIIMIIDGLVLGIQSNQMNKLIPQSIKQNQQDYRLKAGILTIFIGAGSMIGSYMSGPITDQFGLRVFGKFVIFAYTITCVLTIAASLQKMYWFACIMSFLWGYTYYLFQGWIFVSILKLFKGKLQAFAINKQVHCVSMAVFQVLVIFTENHFDIKWLMLGIVVLIIPIFWSLSKVDYSQEKYGSKLTEKLLN